MAPLQHKKKNVTGSVKLAQAKCFRTLLTKNRAFKNVWAYTPTINLLFDSGKAQNFLLCYTRLNNYGHFVYIMSKQLYAIDITSLILSYYVMKKVIGKNSQQAVDFPIHGKDNGAGCSSVLHCVHKLQLFL